MSTMSSSEAREHFPDLVNEATYSKKRTIVTRRGKKVAAIIPMEDLLILQELEDAIDLQEAKKALQEVKKQGAKSWKQFKTEHDL